MARCGKIKNMIELKKNQIHSVLIESYSSEGNGVCRIGGRAVFVPRALIGEAWQIRILKVTSAAVFARGEILLSASPARRESQCPFYGKCGGCDLWDMSYEEELSFKLRRVNDALSHIGKQQVMAEEILGSDPMLRYRNKGIFAVAEENGTPCSGFYRERTHELIPVDSCLIQNELSERVASSVIGFMREYGIAAYDEATGKGVVRHIFSRRAVKTDDAVSCLVCAGGFGVHTGALADTLRKACPELTGIVLNVNKQRGNTILSGDFYTLWGSPDMVDELCGVRFRISPQAFFQINPLQAEKLYEKALSFADVSDRSLVFDLYCGAGTISLCLARRAGKVIGAEIVPEAVENARQNAAMNGIENVEFLCADAGEAARILAGRALQPEVVVVDPPRKGMSMEAIQAVCSMQPDRVVYVSCDPATLARDILRFSECGYQLQKACAVDMFPRTRHVETVCCLYHQKKGFISVPYEPKSSDYLKQNMSNKND